MKLKEKRPTRDEIFMAAAHLFSLRNTCSRLDVGAVAVRDKRIIATGYNGPLLISGNEECSCDILRPCSQSIHAEANLVAFSAKHGISLQGSTLYLTHFPCRKCQELIVQSGIGAIVYDNDYRDMNSETLDFGNIIIRRYEGDSIQVSFK